MCPNIIANNRTYLMNSIARVKIGIATYCKQLRRWAINYTD